MAIRKMNEKDIYYTYKGYSFRGEWNEKRELYNNEIISPRGIRYISDNSLDAYEFNMITSADVCAKTKNSITIKEFARIINRWEDYIKNGHI